MGDQQGPPLACSSVAERSRPRTPARATRSEPRRLSRSTGQKPRPRSWRDGPERRTDLEHGDRQVPAARREGMAHPAREPPHFRRDPVVHRPGGCAKSRGKDDPALEWAPEGCDSLGHERVYRVDHSRSPPPAGERFLGVLDARRDVGGRDGVLRRPGPARRISGSDRGDHAKGQVVTR